MTKITSRFRKSQFPTPELSEKGKGRDTHKEAYRSLIQDIILHHRTVYLGKKIEQSNTYQMRYDADHRERPQMLFVLVPGVLPEGPSSERYLYISAGVEWGQGETKMRYFCGTQDDYTSEELSLPLDTTLVIGRKEPVFSAFVQHASLSATHARICVVHDSDRYLITIKDGSDKKSSSNGSTILVPLDESPTSDRYQPRWSGFRTKR